MGKFYFASSWVYVRKARIKEGEYKQESNNVSLSVVATHDSHVHFAPRKLVALHDEVL